jgi:hypothetical protein
MKSTKKILSIILAIAVIASVFATTLTSCASTTVKKDMMQYTSFEDAFKKKESEEYKCAVANNKDNYIKVRYEDWGESFRIWVEAKKVQKSGINPVVTVYKEGESKTGQKTIFKKYQINVIPAKKIEMSNVKLNKGVEKQITLKNPYTDSDKYYYRFEYNKSIISIRQMLYYDNKEDHLITGLKNGTTTVKAYLQGTKKLIGQFTVTVGDYKASIKKSYQNKTIYYNKHIDPLWLIDGKLDLSEAISNFHPNAEYTVTASNSKIVGSKSFNVDGYYTDFRSKFACVYGKKTGKVTLTVYEKRGKAAKKKIGTIKLTIKQAKDSKVYESYREYDNDGIFYENFISPGESYDLKSAVVSRYLNCGNKKYHFKSSEYTFTAKSSRPDIISVDKKGVCHCKKLYSADDKGKAPDITYTIKFKDGSKVSGGGQFDIVSEDYWD